MLKDELQKRTKEFCLRIIKLVNALPNNIVGRAIASQSVRSGSSVGANYRSACRGRSKAEFIAKIGIVLEEVDECSYWLEIIAESKILNDKKIANLKKETEELTAIFYSILKSSKQNLITSNS